MQQNALENDSMRRRLHQYLVTRLGSHTLATRAARETLERVSDSGILAHVGNQETYIQGFALSVALRMREYYQAGQCAPDNQHDQGKEA
ncbi:hypothetical protein [Gilvimarinus sp. DA14]|uniref:hypothetical protein n=1 Tax=Gilvimarinus sp. DA14 TaxID=2956798 RepID=UPI0020B6DC4B|nr:hypothetical protein [Gilvimarinus sp. DA14]UTF59986.1 hypothetical protein NHM04_16170 [Gilvimarinus sp. DA14]